MAARKKSVVLDRRAELVWMREQLRARIENVEEAASGVASAVRQLRAVIDAITALDAEAQKTKTDGVDQIAAQRAKRKASA